MIQVTQKKFQKLLNFEHAQKGPKWQKLGPNTLYSCIVGLKMSQLNVKSDTNYPEKISKKYQIFNMPKKAQDGPKWQKLGPNTLHSFIFGLIISQLVMQKPLVE